MKKFYEGITRHWRDNTTVCGCGFVSEEKPYLRSATHGGVLHGSLNRELDRAACDLEEWVGRLDAHCNSRLYNSLYYMTRWYLPNQPVAVSPRTLMDWPLCSPRGVCAALRRTYHDGLLACNWTWAWCPWALQSTISFVLLQMQATSARWTRPPILSDKHLTVALVALTKSAPAKQPALNPIYLQAAYSKARVRTEIDSVHRYPIRRSNSCSRMRTHRVPPRQWFQVKNEKVRAPWCNSRGRDA